MLTFNLNANTIRKETNELNNRKMMDRALNTIYCSLFNFKKYAEIYVAENEYAYASSYLIDKGITLIKTNEPCIYKAILDPNTKEGKQTLDSIEMSKQTILDGIADNIARALKNGYHDIEYVIDINNHDIDPDFDWLIDIIKGKNFKIEIDKDYNFSKGTCSYVAKIEW